MRFICYATVANVLQTYMYTDDVLTFTSYICVPRIYIYNHKCERMLFSGGTLMYMSIIIPSSYPIHAKVCFTADLNK